MGQDKSQSSPYDSLSDYCLVDHWEKLEGVNIPSTPKWWLRGALMAMDRRMHFTGVRGALWQMLGVTRSPRNPNICNLCFIHMEAGRLSEVTVLFADCRGFTTLMREQGPEAVRPLVDGFFRRCHGIVVGQDGIVDHFLGDAVLALFNVPIHHEDHVARAVMAAVEIQKTPEQHGPLRVGIGITSGLAFTGMVGSNNCGDYTALGDAVNLAARLQGEAAPGEVLLDEAAYLHVKDVFPFANERAVQVKGISGKIKAYPLDVAGTGGL